jgi:hypothetical protein
MAVLFEGGTGIRILVPPVADQQRNCSGFLGTYDFVEPLIALWCGVDELRQLRPDPLRQRGHSRLFKDWRCLEQGGTNERPILGHKGSRPEAGRFAFKVEQGVMSFSYSERALARVSTVRHHVGNRHASFLEDFLAN